MKYQKHIFVCTNQKAEGKKCCSEAHGTALVEAFKEAMKDRDLLPGMRAQRTGCLDVCGKGPALAIYPDGIIYGNVQLSDVEEIVESHLVNNQPVERLRLDF